MVFSNIHLTSPIPIGYLPPRFPSLYWPINPPPYTPVYLYYSSDIIRFTLYWTLLLYGLCFIAVGAWGVYSGAKGERGGKGGKGKKGEGEGGWLGGAAVLAAVGVFVGGVEALLAGGVVGAILAAVYNAGFFRMSTWIPCVWGVINILVLILSSFSLQGGL
ncbi:hypothetical protein DFH27DRAFT_622695 [Peziza echinospora]|nr:hypothetical protein DFH27DRAFT_622695 [Peziza echinospora]